MESKHYDLAHCAAASDEHLFLSVSDGFEYGPGIHRDGVSEPSMLDPHCVARIKQQRKMKTPVAYSRTTNGFLQRAGTWTIYHHVKNFIEKTKGEWEIRAVQSNGDLTMNPWHVAYVGRSPLSAERNFFCGLYTEGDEKTHEPIDRRTYRCLIKWTAEAAAIRGCRYEFGDVQIRKSGDLYVLLPAIGSDMNEIAEAPRYDAQQRDISSLVEFALAGKPIIENHHELPLAHAVDRFQDVRHVFNVPRVSSLRGQITLGEYQLFHYINERRGALYTPIVVNLRPPNGQYEIDSDVLDRELRGYQTIVFERTSDFPARPGQFRFYPGDRDRLEIFLQHAIYPFGALGIGRPGAADAPQQIVTLSCGGLSGRVGNTLQGVTRMMSIFLRCSDAMILDEGLDVCMIVNASPEGDVLGNEALKKKVLTFTRERLAEDDRGSKELRGQPKHAAKGMKQYPLNRPFAEEVENDFQTLNQNRAVLYDDVFRVRPGRAQIRSMLIYATKSK